MLPPWFWTNGQKWRASQYSFYQFSSYPPLDSQREFCADKSERITNSAVTTKKSDTSSVLSFYLTSSIFFFQFKKDGVHESQKKVDEILAESRAIVKEDFFREHERDHFQRRIEIIDKRNKELDEKAAKEERRY